MVTTTAARIEGSLQVYNIIHHPITHENNMGKLSSLLKKDKSSMRNQASTTEPKGLMNSDIIHHKTLVASKLVIFFLDESGLLTLGIFNHTLSMCRVTGHHPFCKHRIVDVIPKR